MNYRDYNDNELISYIKEQNEEAHEIIFKKYEPLINKIATKMFSGCYNLGFEKADLIQEGMLGLSAAIKTFDESKEASFYTYANKIIERKMLSVIIAAKRLKHKILNESLSLESSDEGKASLEDFVGDDKVNPESLMIDVERERLLIERTKEKLTSFEEQVFLLKIHQFDYKEIATILDKKPKAIDNALQRIKLKMKDELEK